VHTVQPDAALVQDFGAYLKTYIRGLKVEKTAVNTL
jgi:hypothetical protein